jgi:hypothetical protein
MIDFKYDILFGLLFWSIKDVPRTPSSWVQYDGYQQRVGYFGYEPTSTLAVPYNRTQNK